MSRSVPSHVLDTIGNAATTTRDLAGGLLHDAAKAAHVRRRSSHRWLPAIAIGAAAALTTALMARRRFAAKPIGVGVKHNGLPDEPPNEGAHTMSQQTDNAKGRIKQAAGVLTGNDELAKQGEHDQQAGKAKQAVDNARDAVNEGIDALKEKLDKR